MDSKSLLQFTPSHHKPMEILMTQQQEKKVQEYAEWMQKLLADLNKTLEELDSSNKEVVVVQE